MCVCVYVCTLETQRFWDPLRFWFSLVKNNPNDTDSTFLYCPTYQPVFPAFQTNSHQSKIPPANQGLHCSWELNQLIRECTIVKYLKYGLQSSIGSFWSNKHAKLVQQAFVKSNRKNVLHLFFHYILVIGSISTTPAIKVEFLPISLALAWVTLVVAITVLQRYCISCHQLWHSPWLAQFNCQAELWLAQAIF